MTLSKQIALKGLYFAKPDSIRRIYQRLKACAMEHRPAYGIDCEYFSKPNVERLFRTVYEMMRETDEKRFPVM